MNEQILKAIENLAERVGSLSQRFETFRDETQKHFESLEREVGWIRGKLEGREEAKSETVARRATWIAIASVLIALMALIKSFFP